MLPLVRHLSTTHMFHSCLTGSRLRFIRAEKEAMMQQVRQELALANAQELMNVRFSSCLTRHNEALISIHIENQREVLPALHTEAWNQHFHV